MAVAVAIYPFLLKTDIGVDVALFKFTFIRQKNSQYFHFLPILSLSFSFKKVSSKCEDHIFCIYVISKYSSFYMLPEDALFKMLSYAHRPQIKIVFAASFNSYSNKMRKPTMQAIMHL